MMGYDKGKSKGHLVTGGSLANIEAIWAARNVKFFPSSTAESLEEGGEATIGHKIVVLK